MKTLLFFAAASMLFAQNAPPLANAQLENRAFSGNLDSQLRSTAPTWLGYEIKTVQRDENCCWNDSNHGCWLEGNGDHRTEGFRSSGPVHLEGSDTAAR